MLIKKSGTYDTSNKLYGRKREKVWIFEDQLQKWGWTYPSKNSHFRLKTFFSQALRKFSIRRMTMFDIFKRRAQHSSLRQ